MLTNSELNQIRNFLALYGKKDSQLTTVTSVENGDYVSIVQGGKNVTITVDLLGKAILAGFIDPAEPDFSGLWDDKPYENSNKPVRSNGIWHAINDDNVINTNQIIESAVTTEKIADGNVTTEKIADEAITFNKLSDEVNDEFAALHSETERFAVTLKSNCSTTINKEITGATLSAPLTITNEIEVFGDAGNSTVVPKSASFSATGGTIVEGNPTTWNLPNTAGSYTATYTAISRSDIQKSASINANIYLRKYFGFSASEPVDITALGTSHASATVSCTVTIPINGTGYKYIYLAVPYNMSITRVIQPDALNAPLAITFVKNINRTIDRQNYSYKLYRSEDTIDSSESKRLTIS